MRSKRSVRKGSVGTTKARSRRSRSVVDPVEATRRFEDPKFRARFEAECRRLDKKLAPLIKATQKSKQLTAEDYAIIVY